MALGFSNAGLLPIQGFSQVPFALGKIPELDQKIQGLARDTFEAQNCLQAAALGLVCSISSGNPLPSILGLGACIPMVKAQQPVGGEFQINTYTTSDQENPSLATLSDGNFVVAWESYGQDGDGFGVYGQIFDNNTTKGGSEFQVNTYTTSNQTNPSIAGLNNGNFVIAWESFGQDGDGRGVYGQIFSNNNTKIGSEFQVNTYTTSYQDSPSIVGLDSGNFVITWKSDGQDMSSAGIYGQLFANNGTKIGNEFQINTYTSYDQVFPEITSLINETFVVTWSSENQEGADYGVYGQIFHNNSTKIGSEFQVNTYTNGRQWKSSIAGLNDGNFVIGWVSNGQDRSGDGIYGQIFNKTGFVIGSEFQVNTYTNGNQSSSSIADLNDGNFVVAWTSDWQDGGNLGVYGQLFATNGTKIGSEFQVNSYTLNHQMNPSVARLNNSYFVVSWSSEGQDGDGYGIYGQIFNDLVIHPVTTGTTTTGKPPAVSESSVNRIDGGLATILAPILAGICMIFSGIVLYEYRRWREGKKPQQPTTAPPPSSSTTSTTPSSSSTTPRSSSSTSSTPDSESE